jgi:adenylate cyclase
MPVSSRRKSKLKSTAIIVLMGVALGLIFPMFSDGFERGRPYVIGGIIGLLIGLSISYFEFFLFKKVMKRAHFVSIILFRTFTYAVMCCVIILAVIAVIRSIDEGMTLTETINGEDFRNYVFHEEFIFVVIYTFVLAFIVNFIRTLSKKMGQGVLRHFISGKYYRNPREEDRIFMFIDLSDSTTIAEDIGHLNFFHLVKEFFYDITDSIVDHKGEILQYVGDEVMVSWSLKDGLQDGNCIRAFYACKLAIQEASPKYLNRFGLVPEFKSGLHCGEVIRGEIGVMKSEIAFYGDVVNTTSRIMSKSSHLERELLLSEELSEKLPPIAGFNPIMLEKLELKGKKKHVTIYGPEVDTIPVDILVG